MAPLLFLNMLQKRCWSGGGLRVLFGACNVKLLHRFWRLGVQMRFLGHALSLRQLVGVPRLALLFPLLVLLV